MANLFDKLKELNQSLNNKLDERTEKKRSSVAYYMDQTKSEIKEIEKMVEKQRELKSLFYKEYQEMETCLEKRRYQKKLAEEAEETKLAEFVQNEIDQYEVQLAETKEHYQSASSQLEELETRMQEMRLKWKNLKTKHLAEIAEKNAEATSKKMDKVIHDMSWGTVTDYHEAQKQRDLEETARKRETITKELSQSFDDLMDELNRKSQKSKVVIKDKASQFHDMIDDMIEQEKINFRKSKDPSMEEKLSDLEKRAKEQPSDTEEQDEDTQEK
ncbi:PspA/IM30 family protein [Listeria grayi]|uniref:PspA/IM30 family protein n=1 Tax=Listeria grayi TaxID=1641 RepID=UPI0016252026|nr:PspA/IM30 family protein [Listeria grayi]MBC1921125.1 PspA/IM30 family protein [Listeria grayi]